MPLKNGQKCCRAAFPRGSARLDPFLRCPRLFKPEVAEDP
jgi:hypothetical protein